MRKTCCSDEDSWRVLSSHCRWCGIEHTSVLEESCEGDSDRLTHNFHPAGFKNCRKEFILKPLWKKNTFVISSLGVICFRLLTFLPLRFLLPKEYNGSEVFDGFLVFFSFSHFYLYPCGPVLFIWPNTLKGMLSICPPSTIHQYSSANS